MAQGIRKTRGLPTRTYLRIQGPFTTVGWPQAGTAPGTINVWTTDETFPSFNGFPLRPKTALGSPRDLCSLSLSCETKRDDVRRGTAPRGWWACCHMFHCICVARDCVVVVVVVRRRPSPSVDLSSCCYCCWGGSCLASHLASRGSSIYAPCRWAARAVLSTLCHQAPGTGTVANGLLAFCCGAGYWMPSRGQEKGSKSSSPCCRA